MSIAEELAEAFRARLQDTYAAFFQSCQIPNGDISPDLLATIESAEETLSAAVAEWILSHVDPAALATVSDRTGVARIRSAMLTDSDDRQRIPPGA